MAESARHLVEEVYGPRPVRQWVLSFPYPLRLLFAGRPEAIGPVMGILQRVIADWLADQAGIDRASAQCGAADQWHTWPMKPEPPVALPDREGFIAEMWEFWIERAASGDAGAAKMLPLFEPWATEQIGKRPKS